MLEVGPPPFQGIHNHVPVTPSHPKTVRTQYCHVFGIDWLGWPTLYRQKPFSYFFLLSALSLPRQGKQAFPHFRLLLRQALDTYPRSAHAVVVIEMSQTIGPRFQAPSSRRFDASDTSALRSAIRTSRRLTSHCSASVLHLPEAFCLDTCWSCG